MRRPVLATALLALACSSPSVVASPKAPPPVKGAAPASPTSKEKPMESAQVDAQKAYREHLARRGVAAAEVQETSFEGTDGWRYLYAGASPGQKDHPAAVAPDGKVLDPEAEAPGLWHEFLGRAGLSAEELAARACWLVGSAALVRTADDVDDDTARKAVRAPRLARDKDGSVTLEFWQVKPPRFNNPALVVVKAKPAAAAAVSSTVWTKVK